MRRVAGQMRQAGSASRRLMVGERQGRPRCSEQTVSCAEQLLQAGRIGQGEPRGAPLRAERDEAAVAQAGQVLAHCGLRQVQVLDQIPHPVLTAGQVLQEGEPGGLGQCVEQRGERVRVRQRGGGLPV